ncbi:hypothetical protein BD311DRAFT_774784 [Dichomitus squalens]|uniref:Uncharacterized protein n=1 Tax=Dichomitus squalens TaxID=114155 RepID=A0A4Q9MYG9_9APHY|nr:hypothetical protein BD311DRAFT_774784 [Dichomitus squalens]
MLWDGNVLLVLYVLHLVFTELSIISSYGLSDISIFTSHLTSVIVSNFLMDLQQSYHKNVNLDTDDPLHTSHISTLRSDTASYSLGPLGAIIGPDTYPADAELEDMTTA